jgi:hypothetical protein
MDWGSVVKAISAAAPILGSLFGPGGTAVGALAGQGVVLAARALGVNPTTDAVAEAIASDPAAAQKLAQFEIENKQELQRLEIKKMEMEYADISGARTMHTATETATGKMDYNLYILAWTIVIGFFVLMGFLLKIPVPPDQNGVIFMLFGSLATGFGQVLQFFFGSSKGSQDKNQQIFQLRSQIPGGGLCEDKPLR